MSCQARSLALESSIWGTAPECWTHVVLVEYPHTWPAKFADLSELHLSEGLTTALNAVRKQDGWKILWIRRPSSSAQYVYWWNLETGDCQVAAQDSDWSENWMGASWQNPHSVNVVPPTVLVCTHGSRDKCCGVLGGVTFAGLRKILPDSVWQVSHLGGHRFAPTALCLPFGLMLGRIEEDDWMDVALAAMSGSSASIRNEIIRGNVQLTSKEQAREIWLREHCGDILQGEEDGFTWRDVDGTEHRIVQTQSLVGEMEVSCADSKTKPVYEWVFARRS